MTLKSGKETRIIEQVADWLVLMQSDDVSEYDVKRLNLWLAQDQAHRDAWQQAQHFLTHIEHLPESVNSQAVLHLNRQNRRRMLKLLSLVFVAPVTGYLSVRSGLHHSIMADHQTEVGESKTVSLADGTIIELNTRTKITTTLTRQERTVNLLTGEIFVTTGKKASTGSPPFRVTTEHGVIEALGTAFNVKTTELGTEVEVSQDAVLITSRHFELVLNAGESLLFNQHAHRPMVNKALLSAMWRKGLFVATSVPLYRLIEELGRYHHRIVSIDKLIRHIQVSGTFDIYDLNGTLALLLDTLPIDIVYRTKWWLTIVPKSSA